MGKLRKCCTFANFLCENLLMILLLLLFYYDDNDDGDGYNGIIMIIRYDYYRMMIKIC